MNQPENQSDRVLTVLEPPPGGWERLRAGRNSASRWAPSWWALAGGGAAAIAWLVVASGPQEIRMQLTGGRLVGERSQGVDVQILENGHAVVLPSADPNVRIYEVEVTNSTPVKTK
jgi:hypothetical protein